MVNIISDVAGQYDALMTLLKKMPDDEVISLGDMVDRGPKSKEVIEFFMKNGKAILGNHEHMMIDYFRGSSFYGRGIWFWNGGSATIGSFDPVGDRSYQDAVPEDVLQWIEGLPLYMEIDNALVSHSFLLPFPADDAVALENGCEFGDSIGDKGETTIIWNRRPPIRRETWEMQIAGHNSQWGLENFRDQFGEYAICLDDSRHKKLTGLHLPSYTIYQEEY